MQQFRVAALDRSGRSLETRLSARDATEAARLLVERGWAPTSIRSGPRTLWEILQSPIVIGTPVALDAQALFLRQLATLVGAGLPLRQSLALIGEQQRGVLASSIEHAIAALDEGRSFSAALSDQPVLPPWTMSVIAASERSGNLARALDELASRLEFLAVTRRQAVTALVYPAMVMASAVAAFVIILTMVVPQFASLFSGREAQLPGLTRFVLALSEIVRHSGLTLVVMVLAGVVGVVLLLRSPGVRNRWTGPLSPLPGAGIVNGFRAAQFAAVASSLLKGGVSWAKALDLLASSARHPGWRDYLRTVERDVADGKGITEALARAPYLPDAMVQLIRAGEKSGHLSDALKNAGELVAGGLGARVQRIVALINPIAIIVLGVVVALLIGGVMLGIFSMGEFAYS